MKQRLIFMSLAIFTAFVFIAAALPCDGTAADTAALAAPGKPLVMWYSRGGTSQLVAETIQKQLGCAIDKIPSTKDRGFLAIVSEQYFGSADEQVKYAKSLAGYNPVFICAPVYFMKVSAPARAFMELNRDSLKGKDIYLLVTLGGKLSDDKKQGIKEYGAGLGLNIRQVAFLQTGKRDQFPQRISVFLKTWHPQARSAQ